MRILLIHNFSRDFNGEDAYYLSQLRLLKKNKHDVVEFTKDNKDIVPDLLNYLKVVRGFYFPEIEKALSKIISDYRFDIVHIHNSFPLITPVIYRICKNSGIPTVQTIHNYRFMCPKAVLFRNGKVCELCVKKNFAYPSIFYGCYHNSKLASLIFSSSFFYHKSKGSFDCIDKYIFPSEFTRRYYIDNLELKENKTTVIPYFVENKSKPFNNHRKYFLFAGRLSEEKGILKLLEIFSNLPSFKLIVLGDGPLRDKVEQYRRYKNIIIKGFVPSKEIHIYFREAICTVIPSLWYEVLPMVLLESFANGTSVIAPKFCSFEEAIRDGETGLFYEQYNFRDLKEKILWAWENKDKIYEMGINVRKEYEKKYIPEIHYEKLMRVYKSVSR